MARQQQIPPSILGMKLGARLAVLLSLVISASVFAIAPAAEAQTFTVLQHLEGLDGGGPMAGLVMDSAGNFYGTASGGGIITTNCEQAGAVGCGTVFEVIKRNSGWVVQALYDFTGNPDGDAPAGRVIQGPDGILYGTTQYGGGGSCKLGQTVVGCGTIFTLQPPDHICATVSCPWTETILHSFNGTDGFEPASEVVFDQAGNFYGTAVYAGTQLGGLVWKMTRTNGHWSFSQIYGFPSGHGDGADPYAGLVFDSAGNLYGTTTFGGGYGGGTVFELTPSASGWTETILYSFKGESDGEYPFGGVVLDQSGTVYGTTSAAGPAGSTGTAFKLVPSGGGWTFSLLSGLPCQSCGTDEFDGSWASPTVDSSGNVYGTTVEDGAFNEGSVFELVRSGENYTYTSLHDFTAGSDGYALYGNVILDSKGNVYGITWGDGVVFEITP